MVSEKKPILYCAHHSGNMPSVAFKVKHIIGATPFLSKQADIKLRNAGMATVRNVKKSKQEATARIPLHSIPILDLALRWNPEINCPRKTCTLSDIESQVHNWRNSK